jgi:hypothetical protein
VKKGASIDRLDAAIAAKAAGSAPACSFFEFLADYARVRTRSGAYAKFGFAGRRPLQVAAETIDAIIRNTADQQAVTIDGDHDAENDLRSAALEFMDAVRAAERAMAATRTVGETDAIAEHWRRVWCNP